MPDSASGVSMTRSSPKSFWRPSVIRKTPPSLPTSSPMTTTLGSFSIAARRPALSPFARVILAMSVSSLERREVGRVGLLLGGELRGLVDVHVVEDAERVGLGEGLAALAEVVAELLGLLLDAVEEVL